MAIQANHRKLGMIAAAVIFLSDQIMKYIVVYPLALQSRQTIELLPFFDLHFVRNFGVSMGFFRADSDAMRWVLVGLTARSEEHTSELQSLMRSSYAVFFLKKKNITS